MKPKRILLLGIFSALVTTILFYVVIQQNNSSAEETNIKQKMTNVVVANQDINQDTLITEELVTLKEMPMELVHANAAKT